MASDCCIDMQKDCNIPITVSYLKSLAACVKPALDFSGLDSVTYPTYEQITSLRQAEVKDAWIGNIDGIKVAGGYDSNQLVRQCDVTAICTTFDSFEFSNPGQSPSECGREESQAPGCSCTPSTSKRYGSPPSIPCSVVGSYSVQVPYSTVTTNAECVTAVTSTGSETVSVSNLTRNTGSTKAVYTNENFTIYQDGGCECIPETSYKWDNSTVIPCSATGTVIVQVAYTSTTTCTNEESKGTREFTFYGVTKNTSGGENVLRASDPRIVQAGNCEPDCDCTGANVSPSSLVWAAADGMAEKTVSVTVNGCGTITASAPSGFSVDPSSLTKVSGTQTFTVTRTVKEAVNGTLSFTVTGGNGSCGSPSVGLSGEAISTGSCACSNVAATVTGVGGVLDWKALTNKQVASIRVTSGDECIEGFSFNSVNCTNGPLHKSMTYTRVADKNYVVWADFDNICFAPKGLSCDVEVFCKLKDKSDTCKLGTFTINRDGNEGNGSSCCEGVTCEKINLVVTPGTIKGKVGDKVTVGTIDVDKDYSLRCVSLSVTVSNDDSGLISKVEINENEIIATLAKDTSESGEVKFEINGILEDGKSTGCQWPFTCPVERGGVAKGEYDASCSHHLCYAGHSYPSLLDDNTSDLTIDACTTDFEVYADYLQNCDDINDNSKWYSVIDNIWDEVEISVTDPTVHKFEKLMGGGIKCYTIENSNSTTQRNANIVFSLSYKGTGLGVLYLNFIQKPQPGPCLPGECDCDKIENSLYVYPSNINFMSKKSGEESAQRITISAACGSFHASIDGDGYVLSQSEGELSSNASTISVWPIEENKNPESNNAQLVISIDECDSSQTVNLSHSAPVPPGCDCDSVETNLVEYDSDGDTHYEWQWAATDTGSQSINVTASCGTLIANLNPEGSKSFNLEVTGTELNKTVKVTPKGSNTDDEPKKGTLTVQLNIENSYCYNADIDLIQDGTDGDDKCDCETAESSFNVWPSYVGFMASEYGSEKGKEIYVSGTCGTFSAEAESGYGLSPSAGNLSDGTTTIKVWPETKNEFDKEAGGMVTVRMYVDGEDCEVYREVNINQSGANADCECDNIESNVRDYDMGSNVWAADDKSPYTVTVTASCGTVSGELRYGSEFSLLAWPIENGKRFTVTPKDFNTGDDDIEDVLTINVDNGSDYCDNADIDLLHRGTGLCKYEDLTVEGGGSMVLEACDSETSVSVTVFGKCPGDSGVSDITSLIWDRLTPSFLGEIHPDHSGDNVDDLVSPSLSSSPGVIDVSLPVNTGETATTRWDGFSLELTYEGKQVAGNPKWYFEQKSQKMACGTNCDCDTIKSNIEEFDATSNVWDADSTSAYSVTITASCGTVSGELTGADGNAFSLTVTGTSSNKTFTVKPVAANAEMKPKEGVLTVHLSDGEGECYSVDIDLTQKAAECSCDTIKSNIEEFDATSNVWDADSTSAYSVTITANCGTITGVLAGTHGSAFSLTTDGTETSKTFTVKPVTANTEMVSKEGVLIVALNDGKEQCYSVDIDLTQKGVGCNDSSFKYNGNDVTVPCDDTEWHLIATVEHSCGSISAETPTSAWGEVKTETEKGKTLVYARAIKCVATGGTDLSVWVHVYQDSGNGYGSEPAEIYQLIQQKHVCNLNIEVDDSGLDGCKGGTVKFTLKTS